MNRNLQRVFLQPHQLIADQLLVILTPEQQHYLYRVLRLTEGSEFIALNGRGKWWRAGLIEGKARLLEEIIVNSELSVEIILAIAMPKGNGMEEIIRQVTELGVSKILPLWSDRTVIKAGTNLGKSKLERWTRIAQESSEQALRTYVPEILEPQPFSQVVENVDPDLTKYICVTKGYSNHLLNCLQSAVMSAQIMVFVGAEGGWTEAEQAMAIAHGFRPVNLGSRVLASVTAPVVALSLISAVADAHSQLQSAPA